MDKIDHKGNFVIQVLALYAANVLLMIVFTSIFGDGAKNLSSIYQMGSKGISVSTLLQFFLSSFLIMTYQHFFFSEKIFKKMMSLWRIVFLLITVFVTLIIFIFIFDWLPMNNLYAWVGFLFCFGGGIIISTFTMIIKTKLENKKYNNLLLKYKDLHKGDD